MQGHLWSLKIWTIAFQVFSSLLISVLSEHLLSDLFLRVSVSQGKTCSPVSGNPQLSIIFHSEALNYWQEFEQVGVREVCRLLQGCADPGEELAYAKTQRYFLCGFLTFCKEESSRCSCCELGGQGEGSLWMPLKRTVKGKVVLVGPRWTASPIEWASVLHPLLCLLSFSLQVDRVFIPFLLLSGAIC